VQLFTGNPPVLRAIFSKQKESTPMKNVTKLFCSGLLVSVLALSGCQKMSSSHADVAVIDLDKVATAMGWLDEMQRNLQSADTEMRSQLDGILRSSIKAIDDAKKQVSTEAKLTPDQIKMLNSVKDLRELEALPLTEKQRTTLATALQEANSTWQKALNSYQQLLQGRRTQLIMSYREKVRPVARRVATAKGMSVVFTFSDNLLYFDPKAVDITNEVIDELQKSGEGHTLGPLVAPQTAAPAPAPSAAAPTTPAPTIPTTPTTPAAPAHP
jgi:Skp family chaperone for outer membrane proteins